MILTGDDAQQVARRLVQWVHEADPAVVQLFWRVDDLDMHARCAVCRKEYPFDGTRSGGGLSLLTPSAAGTIASTHGFAELASQPLLQGEYWYSYCGACRDALSPGQETAPNADVAQRIALVTGKN